MKRMKSILITGFEWTFLFVTIALAVVSILALILIHVELNTSGHPIEVTREGVLRYLYSYSEFSGLFAATVATLAGYLGLLRLKLSEEAQLASLSEARFTEWKHGLEVRMVAVEGEVVMKREFIRVRRRLFVMLRELNFRIQEKEQLERIFDDLFREMVPTFEINNGRYISFGGVYSNAKKAYSLSSFQFFFFPCADETYDDMLRDLRSLYISALVKDRTIDRKLYQAAVANAGKEAFNNLVNDNS